MIKAVALLALLGLAGPVIAQIQLQHHDGTTLILPREAQRVVTLAPNLAELVFAAGGGHKLVATVEYSDYPAAAKKLPRVGDAFRVDLEALLALQPDLVIIWASGNPAALVDRAEQLGLPVWRTEVTELADIPQLMLAMGTVMGTSEHAEPAVSKFHSRLSAIKSQYENAEPVSYFYQVAERPLYTVSAKHLISHSLGLCGGVNVFAGLNSLAPSINTEAVLDADPELMFAPGGKDMNGGLDQWRRWRGLKAVQQDHLYYLDADRVSRASPRFLDTLEEACHYLSAARLKPGFYDKAK